jgi:hypothetical protein
MAKDRKVFRHFWALNQNLFDFKNKQEYKSFKDKDLYSPLNF